MAKAGAYGVEWSYKYPTTDWTPFAGACNDAIEALFRKKDATGTDLIDVTTVLKQDVQLGRHDLQVMRVEFGLTGVMLLKRKKFDLVQPSDNYYCQFWDDSFWKFYDIENTNLILDAKKYGHSRITIVIDSDVAYKRYRVVLAEVLPPWQENLVTGCLRPVSISKIAVPEATDLIAPPESYHKIANNVDKKIADELTCPISYEIMHDPVVAEDGHTYEREHIVKVLETTGKSPFTQQTMGRILVPNRPLRNMIQALIPSSDKFSCIDYDSEEEPPTCFKGLQAKGDKKKKKRPRASSNE